MLPGILARLAPGIDKAKSVHRTATIAVGLGLYLVWRGLCHECAWRFAPTFVFSVESCVGSFLGGTAAAGIALILFRKDRLPRSVDTSLLALQIVAELLFDFSLYALPPGPLLHVAQAAVGGNALFVFIIAARRFTDQDLGTVVCCIGISMGTFGIGMLATTAIVEALPVPEMRMGVDLALVVGGFFLAGPLGPSAPQNEPRHRVRRDGEAAGHSATGHRDARRIPEIPPQLVVHLGIYMLTFGLTHSMASGTEATTGTIGLPTHMGILLAGIIFTASFACSKSMRVWTRVKNMVFPLTVISFILLPLAHTASWASVLAAETAFVLYLAVFLVAVVVIARKTGTDICALMALGVFIATLALSAGVATGALVRIEGLLIMPTYSILGVAAFAALMLATFWLGDDKTVGRVWGMEKKLTPRRYADELLRARSDALAMQAGLTGREREVLFLLGQHMRVSEIAERQNVSLNTAKTHVAHIHRKLGVHSNQEVAKLLEEKPHE